MGSSGSGGSTGLTAGGGNAGTSAAGNPSGGTAGAMGQEGGSGPGGNAGSNGEGGSAGQSQAGAGGSGGSGGAGGSGGDPPLTCLDFSMIDDFEDGDDDICQNEGRTGQWYVYTTSGATLSPSGSPVNPAQLAAPREQSTRAMHFVSTGGDVAVIGLSLVGIGNQAQPYDASSYTGISFYVWSDGINDFDLVVETTATEPIANGGSCASGCLPNKIYKIAYPGWSVYQVAWYDLDGGNAAFDPSTIRSIAIKTSYDTDFWIDDISFDGF